MDPGTRLAPHAHHLRLLLAHLVGRALRARVDLEDLEQEVYLRALAAPSAWPPEAEGDAALFRYLARTARRVVIDAARALRALKRDARLERSSWSQFGAATPGPATRLIAAETGRALERAFDALAPDHRRVLGLRQLEGLSAAETARRMGRSEAAVHSLYRRALAAWEVALKPDG